MNVSNPTTPERSNMRKTTILAAAAVAVAPLLLAQPAEAALIGGKVEHYARDAGYDRPIVVWCDGRQRTIPEGRSSDNICNDEDVERVWLRGRGSKADEELWCWHTRGGLFWQQRKGSGPGWVDWDWNENRSCTLRLEP